MKRPSFQFYPADWRKDANLRRCSPAARGVWMDVLCVLHDSDTYGIVTWPLKELASAAGASVTYLRELVEKRVLKGCDKGECEALIFTPRHGRKLGTPVMLVAPQAGPIWFSARFVRDEHVRTIRGESSRFGDAPDDAPIPPFGDGPSSATTSSPSGSSDTHTAGAALPEVWMLTKPLRDEAIAEFPHWTADTLVAIAKQFTDHHRAAGSLSHDWDASFRKWCRDDLTQRAHPIPKAAASAKTPSNTVPSSDDKATKAWIADHSAPVEQTPEQRAATAERLRLARETLTRQAA